MSLLFAVALASASGQPTLSTRNGIRTVEQAIRAIQEGSNPPVSQNPSNSTLQGLFRSDDYPADALERGDEGSVGVMVSIDKKGLVRDCVVSQSSGSAALDAQTCRIIWTRAKFSRARDARGKPAAISVYQTITWRIADRPAPSESWWERMTVSFGEGRAPSCRYEFGGAIKPKGPGMSECQTAVPPAPDLTGLASQVIFVSKSEFKIGDKPLLSAVPGSQLIGRRVAKIEVDAAGIRLSCAIIDATGQVPPDMPDLCKASPKRYVPRKDAHGIPVGFTAYLVIEGHLRFEKTA